MLHNYYVFICFVKAKSLISLLSYSDFAELIIRLTRSFSELLRHIRFVLVGDL